mmetsp:Transcript_19937/g.52917  ORF Transcript_19937/g.52917 Transcript_19937/m.52917 type:complete len:567 (-) Transcript_19937:143-1843(-)
MVFTLSMRLVVGLAALLAPRPAAAAAAEARFHWRSFGQNTICATAAPGGNGSETTTARDPAGIHAGVRSLGDCKALCSPADGCLGVEYASLKTECTVLTQAISHARLAAGGECLSYHNGHTEAKTVFVMLPLTVVTNHGALEDPAGLEEQFKSMESADIDGFMVDVWWGITEPTPKAYNFAPYRQLVEMAKARSWKVQMVSSFHQCGGNVGDDCNIPLPKFVHDLEGIWYTDEDGNIIKEYISLFADAVRIHEGRTPLQMYHDWFAAFAKEFDAELGNTIAEIMVGMGPCGELRYPSYRLDKWNFCGIGEFQCYDPRAKLSLAAAAAAAGHNGSSWARPPNPSRVGDYNSKPADTLFFTQGSPQGYTSEEGKFFLDWYSSSLKTHGSQVLAVAKVFFTGRVGLSGKVAGIHWWYDHPSHAAELTAGYYNTNGRNAYNEIADIFAEYGAFFDFTCLEMRNTEQPAECSSNPEMLVVQAISAAEQAGAPFGGENALPRFDDRAYNKMLEHRDRIHAISYLRQFPALVETGNLARFSRFVTLMHGIGNRRLLEDTSGEHLEQQTEFMVV